MFNKQIVRKFKSTANLPAWLREGLPLHKQIIAIRKFYGMSQLVLAKMSGTTQKAISDIENEKVSPTIRTLEKIAKALRCDLSIHVIPTESLDRLLGQAARKKAEKIVQYTSDLNAMEDQGPSRETEKDEIITQTAYHLEHPSDIWK